MRKGLCHVLPAVLVLALARPVSADYISDTLRSAGPSNYAILNIGTGNAHVALNGPGTTVENVGVLSRVLSLASSTPPAVQGNVYLGNSAILNFWAANQVSGTVFTNQNAVLGQARTDALNASNAFAALAPTQTVPGGDQRQHDQQRYHPMGTPNVVNISGINLGGGKTLTLNGPPGTQFVSNNSGVTSGKLLLTGGVTASDVINFTGTSPKISASGGGNHAHFVSGAEVHSPGSAVPPPPSVILLGLGGVAFVVLAARSRRSSVALIN